MQLSVVCRAAQHCSQQCWWAQMGIFLQFGNNYLLMGYHDMLAWLFGGPWGRLQPKNPPVSLPICGQRPSKLIQDDLHSKKGCNIERGTWTILKYKSVPAGRGQTIGQHVLGC